MAKSKKEKTGKAAAADRKVRIGIVGAKFAADFHTDSYRRNDKADVVAVADINPDALKAYVEKWKVPDTHTDYREMLKRDDIDLVSICAPNFLHAEIITECARAGKHVVCEKPLATTAADARKAVEACRKAGVKLMYAEDWVYAPALRRTIEIIEEGAIGKILYVKAKEVHNGTHSPFARDRKTCGGGCLIHLAIHPIGWVLHLLSRKGANKVVEVIGKVNGGGEDNYVHKQNSGEDFALGVMKFQDGTHAFVEGNYITVGGMQDRIEIYGSEGNISVDMTFGSPITVYSRPGYKYAVEKADNTIGWTKPAVDEFYNLGYVHELAAFVEYVRTGAEPLWGCSPDAGLACVEIVEAMYRSSAEGRTVKGAW
ncbi:MAG: Gfo/Idh/MocA family oxidoreductase [Planctomycetota bacterium]|nr:Gfo/Idh/MocA family oxidoreductase [Planctomycetota bacterium]